MAGEKSIRLSKRMEAIASLVTPGNIVADVGTDHAYLPIALVQRGTVPSAIAMDVRKGPLARAGEHIAQNGLGEKIQSRLSDGVAQLSGGEADTIVIAGMGGKLVMEILAAGDEICRCAGELILQPQSHINQVRLFLERQGYTITHEKMIEEDGKFYPMMRAVPVSETPDMNVDDHGKMSDLEICYGPILLREKNPVLGSFLRRQHRQLEQVIQRLKEQPLSRRGEQRAKELEADFQKCIAAEKYLFGSGMLQNGGNYEGI